MLGYGMSLMVGTPTMMAFESRMCLTISERSSSWRLKTFT